MPRFSLHSFLAAAFVLAFATLAAPSAHAQSFLTFEVSPGVGGFEAIDSFGMGVAATIYAPLDDDMVAVGFRPEFAWHKLDIGNDYFFSGNVQLDVRASETVVPSFWIGGGLNKFSGKGPSLAAFLATSPSEGQLIAFLSSGAGGGNATGGLLNVGAEVKIFPVDFFYFGPEFTYTRGLGDVEGNSFRAAMALGAAF